MEYKIVDDYKVGDYEDLFKKIGVEVKKPDGTDKDSWEILDDLCLAWHRDLKPKKKWWQFWRKY